MRLLLVEDEAELAKALSVVLGQHNYVVDHMPNLALAREAALHKVHDAIILDRQLPDGDGLSFLRELRDAGDSRPVIMLTAFNQPEDRITGLDKGADDYVGKPILTAELMARLRAVTRRSDRYSGHRISEGNVTLDLESQEVTVDGNVVALGRREILVLQILLKRAGRTVLRRALEETVYGFDDEIQSNALDSHVSRLRKKLLEAGADVTIHSIRGLGYLLKAA